RMRLGSVLRGHDFGPLAGFSLRGAIRLFRGRLRRAVVTGALHTGDVSRLAWRFGGPRVRDVRRARVGGNVARFRPHRGGLFARSAAFLTGAVLIVGDARLDRKSTRLNSSHVKIS